MENIVYGDKGKNIISKVLYIFSYLAGIKKNLIDHLKLKAS